MGIGSAAHSHRDGVRWWNVRTPDRYIDAVGGRPLARGRPRGADRRPARVRGALALPAHAAWRAVGQPGAPRGARGPRRARRVPGRADRAGPPAGQRGQRQNPLRYPAPMNETAGAPAHDLMEKVVRLCRTRGFIFPSAEIYGGFRSTYDYGPLGVNMLRNVKNAWWRVHGPAARRRGRARRRHPVAPRRLGGLGPPRDLHRPAGRLPQLPRALAGRQDRRRLPQLRVEGPDRGPGLPPDVQDPRRPGGGRGPHRLPAPRDGPGHVHQLRQRARHDAQEAALRHRPGGQVLPQRDHAAELRLPHPRVRADGDGVLRPARRGPEVVRLLARRAHALVPRPRHAGRQAPPAPPRARASSRTTRVARRTWSSSSPGAGTSWRASPTGATTTSRRTPPSRASRSTTSTSRPTSATRRT